MDELLLADLVGQKPEEEVTLDKERQEQNAAYHYPS